MGWYVMGKVLKQYVSLRNDATCVHMSQYITTRGSIHGVTRVAINDTTPCVVIRITTYVSQYMSLDMCRNTCHYKCLNTRYYIIHNTCQNWLILE